MWGKRVWGHDWRHTDTHTQHSSEATSQAFLEFETPTQNHRSDSPTIANSLI